MKNNDLLDQIDEIAQEGITHIEWWEKRRLRFNLILLITLLGILLIGSISVSVYKISYLFGSSMFLFLFANILYTSGSTLQYLVGYYSKGQYNLSAIRDVMYWFGVLISITITARSAMDMLADLKYGLS